MTIEENKQKLKPTCTQQELNFNKYFVNERTSYMYCCDYMKFFADYCIKYLGWELAPGPGTSLGLIMHYPSWRIWFTGLGNYSRPYPSLGIGNAGWDCDWTQEDGLVSWTKDLRTLYYYKGDGMGLPYEFVINDDSVYKQPFLLNKSWFENFPLWNNKLNTFDTELDRFDFILYVGENGKGQKIGLRFKYPVCSVGYNNNADPGTIRTVEPYYGLHLSNILYTVPIVTIYNNEEGNMNQNPYYTNEVQGHLIESTVDSPTVTDSIGSPMSLYGSNTYNFYPFRESNFISICTSFKATYWEDKTTLWEKHLEYAGKSRFTTDGYVCSFSSGEFLEWDKPYFKFQNSKSKSTQFVTLGDSKDIYISILVTELEDGEKIVMVLNKKNLCQFYGTTSSYKTNLLQGKTLVEWPETYFNSIKADDNNFVVQRAILPGQKVLCKELYYLTHCPSDFNEGKGYPYIYAKNEEGVYGCYRIIENDNKWKLAFPIVSPKEELEYES